MTRNHASARDHACDVPRLVPQPRTASQVPLGRVARSLSPRLRILDRSSPVARSPA